MTKAGFMDIADSLSDLIVTPSVRRALGRIRKP
jgi:hypothetical protein